MAKKTYIPALDLIHSLKAGDTVRFMVYAGRGRNGSEWKPKTAKVIISAHPIMGPIDNVVCGGGLCGNVVDARNIIGASGGRVATPEITRLALRG